MVHSMTLSQQSQLLPRRTYLASFHETLPAFFLCSSESSALFLFRWVSLPFGLNHLQRVLKLAPIITSEPRPGITPASAIRGYRLRYLIRSGSLKLCS